MKRDIRDTPLFDQARATFESHLSPGSGHVIDAQDVHATGSAALVAFAGTLVDKAEGTPPSRICTIDTASGALAVRTQGGGTHRLPRVAPDQRCIAYLSDRDAPGAHQPWLLDAGTWVARHGPQVDGFAESLDWSADGRQLLMVVAGAGADLAGAQGGFNPNVAKEAAPDWAPEVDTGANDNQWRSVWIGGAGEAAAQRVSPMGINAWEAAWCGEQSIVMVASDAPDEAAWYRARVVHVDIASGAARTLYTPQHHLGGVAASPLGSQVAVIEAICSDRTIVAGDIVLVPAHGGPARRVATAGTDVNFIRFIDEKRLMFAGHRSFETVLAVADLETGDVRVLWASSELTFGGSRYPEFALLPGERIATCVEGFLSRPTVSLIGADGMQALVKVGNPALDDELSALVERASPLRWKAPDGLEIHGWLIEPKVGEGPRPLTMEIHGGPVWQWRARWLGGSGLRRMLLARGHALFLPNPRGSSGRGQGYAGKVLGDMGGADTHDYLSGVDHLVARGVADARNLFVIGGSYGGFMSSWLVTQDTRFAAAVPIGPVTNWYSEHLMCHIPYFCGLFLNADLREPGSRYFTRSPVFYAERVTTPVLNVAGSMDRNTPFGQAVEFHHALLEHGKKSALLLYPKEGHGVRTYPALFDFAARVVDWLEAHRR